MIKYCSYKKLTAIQKKSINTKTIRTKSNILSISRVKTKLHIYFTQKNIPLAIVLSL